MSDERDLKDVFASRSVKAPSPREALNKSSAVSARKSATTVA